LFEYWSLYHDALFIVFVVGLALNINLEEDPLHRKNVLLMSLRLPLRIYCYMTVTVVIILSLISRTWASTNQGTSLQFTITNSYSGSRSISTYSGSMITIGGITRVDSQTIPLSLMASTLVQYGIAGDIVSPMT
jgi:hypothetical protein